MFDDTFRIWTTGSPGWIWAELTGNGSLSCRNCGVRVLKQAHPFPFDDQMHKVLMSS
jgi:hypothetical protein